MDPKSCQPVDSALLDLVGWALPLPAAREVALIRVAVKPLLYHSTPVHDRRHLAWKEELEAGEVHINSTLASSPGNGDCFPVG